MAYNNTGGVNPVWLNKGDHAWQLTAATLVGLQSMPGLVVLYGGIVLKKWSVNSAFMALYAFAATLLCWVTWAYKMSFGEKLIPFLGKPGPALDYPYLLGQATLPATIHYYKNGTVEMKAVQAFYAMEDMVLFQFCFAAITVVLLAGSVLGRMSFRAWMLFVPLWITFSYTVGAFSVWGGGFLWQWGVIDYAGGYVIHVSSGVSGFVAAYWVGPRPKTDRRMYPPHNLLLVLVGAGLLWMGWAGFNGGATYSANTVSGLAVLNTHICTATSLLTWTALDVFVSERPSVIGAVQGMMTGLVTITPAAGFVQAWAALVMGLSSGAITWVTMTVVHRRVAWLRIVDDTLGVFYTHAVAGVLGGIFVGLFAEPTLCTYMGHVVTNSNGLFYGGNGAMQLVKQIVGALFIIAWNLVVTTIIMVCIRACLRLQFSEPELEAGDDAVQFEVYATWGDAEAFKADPHGLQIPDVEPDVENNNNPQPRRRGERIHHNV